MRLIDCFTALFAYAGHAMTPEGMASLSFEQFRKDLDLLLERSEGMYKKGGIPFDDYDQARFAVCAWVDEEVLTSTWTDKDRWAGQQLQRRYYHTTNAGEEFFHRLDRLNGNSRPVLEVYGACLVMGFRGRYYAIRDLTEVEAIGHEVLQRVMADVTDPFSAEELKFFPESYLDEKERPKRRSQLGLIPVFIFAGAAAVASLSGIFIFMSWYLDKIVNVYFNSGM